MASCGRIISSHPRQLVTMKTFLHMELRWKRERTKKRQINTQRKRKKEKRRKKRQDHSLMTRKKLGLSAIHRYTSFPFRSPLIPLCYFSPISSCLPLYVQFES